MDTALREQADSYSLGHATEEYERLRAQSRVWEQATVRLLDQVGLGPGASCLDAGCGPGEVMRLMATRVGPSGRVLGMDVDPRVGGAAQAVLHRAGHHQCAFRCHDLNTDQPIPGGPFDLVYARLLLFHLPQRVAVLRRLWAAVAPGGHLVVQDYDLHGVGILPELNSGEALTRVVREAMTAAGCDIHAGARLPLLFTQAGIGDPDGTDVTGRIEPLATGRTMLEATFRSVLPTALAHGIISETDATAALAAFRRDAITSGDRPTRWPLLIGVWKRKQMGDEAAPLA
jgi:ubiquinone/menaquinone biosynthesis C-methylase UbiE